jgi:hypothetical protein
MNNRQDNKQEDIRKFREMVHAKALKAKSQKELEYSIQPALIDKCSFVLKSSARNYDKRKSSQQKDKNIETDKKKEERRDLLRLYVVLEKANLHDDYLETLIAYGVESVNDIILLNDDDFEKMGICRKSGELLRLISFLERLGIFDQHFTKMFDYGFEKISDIHFINSKDFFILDIQEYTLGKLRLCAFLDQHKLFDKCYDALDEFGVDYVKDLPNLTENDFDHLKIGVLQRTRLVAAAIDFK